MQEARIGRQYNQVNKLDIIKMKTFKKIKDGIIEVTETKKQVYCVDIEILKKEIQEKQELLNQLKGSK